MSRRLTQMLLTGCSVLALGGLPSLKAAVITWDATTGSWNTASNWDPDQVPGINDDVNIGGIGTSNISTTLDGNQAANTITFASTSTATTKTITAGGTDRTLTIGTGINKTGSGQVTIGSATAGQRVNIVLGSSAGDVNTLGANQSWSSTLSNGITIVNGLAGTASLGNTQTLTLTGTAGYTFNTTAAITDGANGGRLALNLHTGAIGSAGMTISSANTYTGGTTLTQGRAQVGNASGLGTGLVTIHGNSEGGGQLFISSGVTLLNDFVVQGAGNRESSQEYAIRFVNNSAIGNSSSTFTVAAAGATIGASGSAGATGPVFNINSRITGTGDLSLVRGGTTAGAVSTGVFTNAANDYTGQTNIGDGFILRLVPGTAAQNSVVNVATGGQLLFGNPDTAAGTYTIGGLAGSGNVALQMMSTSPMTLQVGNANKTGMVYSGALSGAGALVKVGTGTQTLTGANVHTGGTTISNGVLVLGASNTLQGATGLTSVAGGTLRSSVTSIMLGGSLSMSSGELDLNGTGAGNLMLNSGSNFTMTGGLLNIDLGTSYDSLIGSGSSAFAISGGTLLLDVTGEGFSYDNQYTLFSGFGGSNSVSNLAITGYDTMNYKANLSSNGVLSFEVVPEPGSLGLLVGALGTFAVVRRRRRVATL